MRSFILALSAFAMAMAAPASDKAYSPAQGDEGYGGGNPQFGQPDFGGPQFGQPGFGGGNGGGGFGGNPGFGGGQPSGPVCAGLPGVPQCCQTNVLGLLSTSCAAPPQQPFNIQHFRDVCATIGQSAQCCLLPAAGSGVACNAP